jgi:hypothetical protein
MLTAEAATAVALLGSPDSVLLAIPGRWLGAT